MAVFSVLARAARLPIEATLTVRPTSAASSNWRLTFLANTRLDSVARRTSFAHLSGLNTPSAIVLSTNSFAPVATFHESFRSWPAHGALQRSAAGAVEHPVDGQATPFLGEERLELGERHPLDVGVGHDAGAGGRARAGVGGGLGAEC